MIMKLFSTKLAKTAYIYTITKFINSGIPFILLPILTRYLTAEEYGKLSMFNATVSFLIPIVGMSIGGAIQRKIVENKENESKEYIFNCLIVFTTATLLVSLLMFIFADPLSKYTTIPKSLLPYVMMTTAGSSLFHTALSFYQIKDRPKSYAVLQNSCTTLNVTLSIILVVVFKLKFPGRVYGITYSTVVFAVISLVIVGRYITGNHSRINGAFIRDEVFNFAVPLIPTEVKATVLTYMDRIFLTNMVNVSTTGVYSLGNQVSLPLLFFEQAFNLAYVPWLYKNLEKNSEIQKRKIVKMTYIYFGVVPLIAVMWSLIVKPAISIITGSGYEDAHIYVIWLSLGYALNGMQMMVVNYISYAKKLNLYAIVTIIVILSNLILNYVFITKDGPVGAAEATLICNAISFVLTWILTIKVYPMPWLYFMQKK